jgi:hypothetical protein
MPDSVAERKGILPHNYRLLLALIKGKIPHNASGND